MSSLEEDIDRFEELTNAIYRTNWGKDSDVKYHKESRRVVIRTDIGLITYYNTTGKFQVKSHIFRAVNDTQFLKFLDFLVRTGTYLWSPEWSSRPVEQDPEWLKKVTHPFVERAK